MALILYSHCFSLCNLFTICSNYIFIFNLVYSCFWVLSSFSHTEFSVVLFHLDFLAFAVTPSQGELCPFPSLLSSTSPWPSFCAVFPKLLHEGSFSHFIKATASLKFHSLNSWPHIWAWLSSASLARATSWVFFVALCVSLSSSPLAWVFLYSDQRLALFSFLA